MAVTFQLEGRRARYEQGWHSAGKSRLYKLMVKLLIFFLKKSLIYVNTRIYFKNKHRISNRAPTGAILGRICTDSLKDGVVMRRDTKEWIFISDGGLIRACDAQLGTFASTTMPISVFPTPPPFSLPFPWVGSECYLWGLWLSLKGFVTTWIECACLSLLNATLCGA